MLGNYSNRITQNVLCAIDRPLIRAYDYGSGRSPHARSTRCGRSWQSPTRTPSLVSLTTYPWRPSSAARRHTEPLKTGEPATLPVRRERHSETMVVRRIQVDGTEDARQVDRAQLRVHERREEPSEL